MLAGPSAIELQVQRVAWGLGLSAAGPDAPRLLQVLPALGTEALLDQHVAVQKVSAEDAKCSAVLGNSVRPLLVAVLCCLQQLGTAQCQSDSLVPPHVGAKPAQIGVSVTPRCQQQLLTVASCS